MVSIPACHAGNPGSIPGLGAFFSEKTICVAGTLARPPLFLSRQFFVLNLATKQKTSEASAPIRFLLKMWRSRTKHSWPSG